MNATAQNVDALRPSPKGGRPNAKSPTAREIAEQGARFVPQTLRYLGVPPEPLMDAAQDVFLVALRRFTGYLSGRGDFRAAGDVTVVGSANVVRNAWLSGSFLGLGPATFGGELHHAGSVTALPLHSSSTAQWVLRAGAVPRRGSPPTYAPNVAPVSGAPRASMATVDPAGRMAIAAVRTFARMAAASRWFRSCDQGNREIHNECYCSSIRCDHRLNGPFSSVAWSSGFAGAGASGFVSAVGCTAAVTTAGCTGWLLAAGGVTTGSLTAGFFLAPLRLA